MEPLLAALKRARNDLLHIHADYQCIETCVKNFHPDYGPPLTDLRNHVHELGRHLDDISTRTMLV
jgi:hypothetical protein